MSWWEYVVRTAGTEMPKAMTSVTGIEGPNFSRWKGGHVPKPDFVAQFARASHLGAGRPPHGVDPMTTPESAGAYAVVRVWSAPAGHRPDAPVDYVSDGTYWYVLGCEDGYSWEQVTRHAVRVEVVREGVAAIERAEAST